MVLLSLNSISRGLLNKERDDIMNNLDQIIRSRRAIYPKQFIGGDISKDILLNILENGNMAPTHRLTQPWIFKVFRSSSKIKLGKEMIKKYHESTENPHESKSEKIMDKCKLSNIIIAICMRRDEKKSIPEWEEIASVSMAVQNIWLSCVNYEIGCYWSSPKYANELSEFLNLGINEKCLGFFYMGKFNHKNQKPTKRNNINSKIEWFN